MDMFRVWKMPKKSSKKGKPAQCKLCGQTRQEYVVLLVNPDPVRHEVWCDDCYVKEVTNDQQE